jgi:23S rRNA pseudouridine955/2504/2580 synthase
VILIITKQICHGKNNVKIKNMKTVIITPQNANQRVDKFVRKWLSDAPLSFIYRIFRKKDVKVNGKRVQIQYILQPGDELSVYVNDQQLVDFTTHRRYQKKALGLPIVYEDDHCLIVHKPKGLLVQGESGKVQETLTDRIINHLYAQGQFNPDTPGFTPAPAHRLDRNTSGLVIYGKTIEGLQALQRLFKEREDLSKDYIALVVGRLEGSGSIDFPLIKDETKKMVYVAQRHDQGMKALTTYEVMQHYGKFTLVKVQLHTGRTHQIRVHFQAIQHPIAGDRKYGDFSMNQYLKQNFDYEHQFLQAQSLSFGDLQGVLSGLANRQFHLEMDRIEQDLLLKLSGKI